MADLSSVTNNMLPVSSETFETTLAGSIAAGATTVPMIDTIEYADGDVVVLTVDPGTEDQATFTGVISGNDVIEVLWTEGNVGADHDAGATVIDYDSATHYNLVTKLLRQIASQDGKLLTSAVQQALNISGSAPADWTPLATVPSVSSVDGINQATLQFPSVNYTDRIQPGTRLRIPRNTTPPTQNFAFTRSGSQYARNTAPTGLTQTDDLTFMAWIKVNSLDTTNATPIIARRANTGNGWQFRVGAQGNIEVIGISGNTNYRAAGSRIAVELGEWVHVAGTLDMSTNSLRIYFNGIEVGASTESGGTPPAFFTSAGDLVLGFNSVTGAASYFDGEMADVRVYNSIRTEADICSDMNNYPATNAGMIAWFKGEGSWNDSSVNANHLTAVGTPSNSTANHPWKAIEYGIVTSVNYVAPNTNVTVYTGKKHCIPNGTLQATSYSNFRVPFGFPSESTAWEVSMYLINSTAAAPAKTIWYRPQPVSFMIPIGAWDAGYNITGRVAFTSTLYITQSITLSTLTNAPSDNRFTSYAGHDLPSGNTVNMSLLAVNSPVKIATPTRYYPLHYINGSGASSDNSGFYGATQYGSRVYFKCAYL